MTEGIEEVKLLIELGTSTLVETDSTILQCNLECTAKCTSKGRLAIINRSIDAPLATKGSLLRKAREWASQHTILKRQAVRQSDTILTYAPKYWPKERIYAATIDSAWVYHTSLHCIHTPDGFMTPGGWDHLSETMKSRQCSWDYRLDTCFSLTKLICLLESHVLSLIIMWVHVRIMML